MPLGKRLYELACVAALLGVIIGYNASVILWPNVRDDAPQIETIIVYPGNN